MRVRAFAAVLLAGGSLFQVAQAEVVSVEVEERRPFVGGADLGSGAYEVIRGVVRYEIDPKSQDARDVADVQLAPRNARGNVEYAGPFVVIRPANPARSNGVTLVEIANRGLTQMNGSLFAAADGFALPDANPSKLDYAGVFGHGYTLAWVAWQGRLPEGAFGLRVPVGTGKGRVRADFHFDPATSTGTPATDLMADGFYCAEDTEQAGAELRLVTRFDDTGKSVPHSDWAFAKLDPGGRLIPDRCAITLRSRPTTTSDYVVVYRGEPAAVMGLGEAAVRDFVVHLKHGEVASELNTQDRRPKAVLGYGYSQSARFLRDFVYRGFNADARRRRVFDGLMVVAAGAGRGSFNHRYALPGQAGNSVGSFLRAVDLYPFADTATPDLGAPRPSEGLLDRARSDGVVPKIFNVFSSSEYWARAGSLIQTTTDGRGSVALAPESRLYHLAGTPHAGMRPARFRTEGTRAQFPYNASFDLRATEPALLEHLRAWVVVGSPPPASRAPSAGTTLVDAATLRFAGPLAGKGPAAPPPVWRLDLGANWPNSGLIAEPPVLGPRYPLFVPAVDADGNEVAGLRGLEARAPLGTYTAWNRNAPGLAAYGYLSGLQGAFVPFALTEADRRVAGDPRPSIEARYGDREGWLRALEHAFDELAAEGWLDPAGRAYVLREAGRAWTFAEDVRSGVIPEPR